MQKAVGFMGKRRKLGRMGFGGLGRDSLRSVGRGGVHGAGVNVATIIELHRMRQDPVATQIAAFLTMPFFAFERLSAIGVPVQ